MDNVFVGVDVGTTRAKVGAFTLDGRPVALKVSDYSIAFDATTNAAEQNPAEWWRVVARMLHELMAEIDPSAVLAICVGGQGPTVVALDEDLQPLGPAFTWMDRRATNEVRLLSERAQRPLPSHAYLPKIMWLKNSRAEIYSAARWFCQAWDFVTAQLIGKATVSTSPAIAPWNDALLAVAELDTDKFPPLQRMGELIGRVTPEAAQVTGLPVGLPVVGGISDYYEGIIGSGALRRGIACDNGGTSQSFNVCWDKPLEGDGVFCLPSFSDGQWYIGGPASTTGKALDWWKQEVLACRAGDWTCLEEARSVPPGSERLIFLPYLAGERAPIWNPHARGVFFGLALNHRRGHMTRAILEAVAYALCHLIEQIKSSGAEVDEIHTCGGQAQSELWSHIKSDATGCRVIVPEIPEASVLGAAIIAGVGIGSFEDYSAGAGQMVRTRAIIEPDADNHARYRSMYAIYRDLYESAKPLYERLGEVN